MTGRSSLRKKLLTVNHKDETKEDPGVMRISLYC